jgi:hypothetical protein
VGHSSSCAASEGRSLAVRTRLEADLRPTLLMDASFVRSRLESTGVPRDSSVTGGAPWIFVQGLSRVVE